MIVCDGAERTTKKIRELEDLAMVLEAHRAADKKIVQCHGVFDQLHIGHIRHLEQGKSLGDILVVTVTADVCVNKGPECPIFPETLRAEAIAALGCVDYVAISSQPTATEAIRMLRPDFYVKGIEHREANKDCSGSLKLEEAAVNAGGGKLAFTESFTFSSSSVANHHKTIFPPAVTDYLLGFSARYSVDKVISFLDSIRPLKVLVVGEAIIDEYRFCEAIGKSSKEPMLAVKHLSTERFAGGILAVGNHVANLCGHVGLLTFLGAERSHEKWISEQLNSDIEVNYLFRKHSPTIVKRRFVESYFFTKLLEVYEMNDGPLDEMDNEALCAALNAEVPKYDVVIVVDFGHGMLSREAIDILGQKARFLAVNAQSNAGNLGFHTISRYPKADYVCIAEHEMRLEARDRRGDLRQMILGVAERLGCERISVTTGKTGCLCYHKAEGFFEVPALASQVVDRMGAGDAFLSVTAPCVAMKVPMEVVGLIGNAVGAHAVATVGHRRSIERISLCSHIESLLK